MVALVLSDIPGHPDFGARETTPKCVELIEAVRLTSKRAQLHKDTLTRKYVFLERRRSDRVGVFCSGIACRMYAGSSPLEQDEKQLVDSRCHSNADRWQRQ